MNSLAWQMTQCSGKRESFSQQYITLYLAQQKIKTYSFKSQSDAEELYFVYFKSSTSCSRSTNSQSYVYFWHTKTPDSRWRFSILRWNYSVQTESYQLPIKNNMPIQLWQHKIGGILLECKTQHSQDSSECISVPKSWAFFRRQLGIFASVTHIFPLDRNNQILPRLCRTSSHY